MEYHWIEWVQISIRAVEGKSKLKHGIWISSFSDAASGHKETSRRTTHLQLTSAMQPVREMKQTEAHSHSKSSSHTIQNFVAQNLSLKLHGMVTWQIHKARYEMNLHHPRLPLPLTKRLDRLIRYQVVIKIEFKNSVLKSHIKFPVRVWEICDESQISIEIPRRIEVYDVQARMICVKNRVFWLDNKKKDQSCDSKQDYKDAEDHTDDGAAPDGRICPAVVS